MADPSRESSEMSKVGVKKKQFSPIPIRAFGDTRLTASQHRLLGAISYHDRFTSNGYGCTAGHEKLSEETGIHYTNISKFIAELHNWGYITIRPRLTDRRRHEYRVVYDDEPKIVGQPANNDGEKVGEENHQGTNFREEPSREYIGLSPFKKSGESGTSNDEHRTYDSVDSGEAEAVEKLDGCPQNGNNDFLRVEERRLEKHRGEARRQIVDRLNDVENGWLVVSKLDDETLTDLENKQINGELTDADLASALKAIKAE